MEGHDTALITSFYACLVFRRNYGAHAHGTNDHHISPPWQSGLLGAAFCGTISGLACKGALTDRFGYRKTLLGILAWPSVFIFASFAFHSEMLLVSQLLCGLSWGIFQNPTTTYAADVMPIALRGHSRLPEAKTALLRLTSLDTEVAFNADGTIAILEHTNEVEKFLNSGNTILACFRSTNRHRTEIACVV